MYIIVSSNVIIVTEDKHFMYIELLKNIICFYFIVQRLIKEQ